MRSFGAECFQHLHEMKGLCTNVNRIAFNISTTVFANEIVLKSNICELIVHALYTHRSLYGATAVTKILTFQSNAFQIYYMLNIFYLNDEFLFRLESQPIWNWPHARVHFHACMLSILCSVGSNCSCTRAEQTPDYNFCVSRNKVVKTTYKNVHPSSDCNYTRWDFYVWYLQNW